MIYIKEAKSKKMPGEYSLFISFSFNQEIINIIKQQCELYDYDKKTHVWEIPELYLSNLLNELVYIDSIDLDLLKDEEINKDVQLVVNYPTKPFDYQLDGIKYGLEHDNWLLLDPPGLGKSLQMIYLAEELKAQRGIEHCLIICGINTLKTNWKKEIQKHSNLDCVIIGEKINSKGKVSYASINERANQLVNKIDEFFIILNIESIRSSLVVDAIRNSVNNFDMIVFDEVHTCLDYNTIINTNLGDLKIGYIVDNNIKCKVLSYNIDKNLYEYKNITNFYKFNSNDLIELKIEENNIIYTIRCTKDHLLYTTNRGWVIASDINENDDIKINKK